MSISCVAATALSILALAASGNSDLPDVPDDVQIPLSPWYTTTNDSIFQAVGDGMINAAEAALPVGIGVMAVTSGIPVAKKVIKQLSA